MLIDTHAHVNFLQYKDDGDEVVRRSLAEGTWLINVGSEKDTSRRAVEYATRYKEGVFAAIGLHPIQLRAQEIEEKYNGELIRFTVPAEEFSKEYYANLAGQEKVVAIGEIGLDYYRNGATKELQKEVFLKQLELAQEFNKPIIIHCREAHEDLQKIFKELISNSKSLSNGVLHSFSGTMAQAQEYLAMGFYLGFNGIITFAREYDEIVKNMPLDRMVLETDCPYLTPVPLRGKKNEPSYVKYVAQRVAELRGISFEGVAEITTANAKKLFRI
jgi:TatD DNase family protein